MADIANSVSTRRTPFPATRWEAPFSYLWPALLLLIFRLTFQTGICDDAYISLKVAMNLADGRGMILNPGEPVYVVTTPLWVFLLAILRTLTSDVILAVRILGIIFELLFLWTMISLGHVLTGNRLIGLLASVLIVSNPVYLLTSFSGMEISMFLFLAAMSFILLARKRHMWSLLTAAIAVWARFDGILLFALVLGWSLFELGRRHSMTLGRILLTIAPSLLIILAYILFGFLCFGDIIPVSAQLKMRIGPDPFELKWLAGVYTLIRNLIYVLVGRLSFWFETNGPAWLLLIPVVVALLRIRSVINSNLTPLLVYTSIYILALLASGNWYAGNFPWYFIVVLPAACILAATGFRRIILAITSRADTARRNSIAAWTLLILAIVWPAIMFPSIRQSSDHLADMSAKRERAYAALTVWLDRRLPHGAAVTSNEIGTIGFFSRPDMRTLDMFGILRTRDDRFLTDMQLVRKYRPEAVLVRNYFPCKQWIIDEMGDGFYTWHEYRGIDIGLRHDIAGNILPGIDELHEIYTTLNVDREYRF